MKMIKDIVDDINDEIESAKEYAEKYVEAKAHGDTAMANRYKEMANDELKHATYLHDFVVKKIDEVSKVYTAPAGMQEAWNKAHKEYVERVAWIKQMLTL
jgi:ferritin